ncbi:hypothetical protein [Haliangium ochraceum]|uniref:LTD domain-containing protein n=1 Tax=Haliangium ochraceum (strain DSM 14365 / JCM 11303 / SMP-2) TaxID=502025 RepID=D0LZK8_HALO1|nr:hypothetical protein [Haliangium ochraceum]ACY17987.1 hypothetical protein Hoch_5504 [Haliangium ochraceum DSM 14365]
MAIRIIEIHPADEPEALNQEWFVLENQGEKPFSTRNCTLSVGRKGQRKSAHLGTIDPGFVISPGEKVRVLTGHPSRKAHGKPPEDEVKQYSLFLNSSVLRGAGSVLTLALRSLPVAKAAYDPDAESGVRPPRK